MITKLTPTQEARLAEVYQEWLAVGRNCEPLNLTEAHSVVNEMYRRIGKPKPLILTFSSPVMCVLAWAVLRNVADKKLRDQLRDQLRGQLWGQLWGQLGGQLWDQLRDQLRDQLWDQLWDQLRGQLRDQLWDQLGGQLWDQLRDQLRGQLWGQLWGQLGGQLGDQLRDQLWDQLGGQLGGQLGDQLGGQLGGQLWDQLGGQLGDQLGDQLWDQLSNYFAGQHWCYWQAFYDFCRDIGVKYADEHVDLLNLWVREGRALHWWFPYEGIVLLSERHTKLHVDDRGRLHSDTEQACGYSDGWGIWAWHGVIVPQDVIEKSQTITVKQIRSHGNIEVRRIMIERYGLSRYLLDSGAKKISEDEFGELYREQHEASVADPAAVGIDEPVTMVKVLNSTPEPDGSLKPYFLRVHPELRPMLKGAVGEPQKDTALNAVASTFGMTGKEYLKYLVEQS